MSTAPALRLGIGGRLLIAFVGVGALAVGACVVGWLSYARLSSELESTARGHVPALVFAAVLGIPCFTAEKAAIEHLQTAIEKSPELVIEADVANGVVSAGKLGIEAKVPPGLRDAFVSDQWNPTSLLLADFDDVRKVAKHLPYVSGF